MTLFVVRYTARQLCRQSTYFVPQIFVGYHNTGKVMEYKCEGREKALARNIVTKNRKAASKAAIDVLGKDLIETYSNKVFKDVTSYARSKDCILKYNTNPDSLYEFTNERFVRQLTEKVPLFGHLISIVCKGKNKSNCVSWLSMCWRFDEV